MTIACSLRVKHVIFPNTFSDNNCTFAVCFETGKWLFSPFVGKIATAVKAAILPSQSRRQMYSFHQICWEKHFFKQFLVIENIFFLKFVKKLIKTCFEMQKLNSYMNSLPSSFHKYKSKILEITLNCVKEKNTQYFSKLKIGKSCHILVELHLSIS